MLVQPLRVLEHKTLSPDQKPIFNAPMRFHKCGAENIIYLILCSSENKTNVILQDKSRAANITERLSLILSLKAIRHRDRERKEERELINVLPP